MLNEHGRFVWDPKKERLNIRKHRISFSVAAKAFEDFDRKIFIDSKHSGNEERHFCIGKVNGKVVTVRFMYRGGDIRIIGAGYWRKGIKYYEEAQD